MSVRLPVDRLVAEWHETQPVVPGHLITAGPSMPTPPAQKKSLATAAELGWTVVKHQHRLVRRF